MTISTTVNKAQYNGDGAQTVFPYPFLVIDTSHFQVYVNAVITTDWTADGIGNASGGNITFNTAPPAGTGNVLITRVVPLSQLYEYDSYSKFPAKSHEANLDLAAMRDQQLQEEVDRAVKYTAFVENPDPFQAFFGTAQERANKVWAFDPTGTLVIVIDTAEEKAYRWANAPENQVVENRDGQDRFSAYHWALKAQNISSWGLANKGDIYVGDGSAIPATVLPVGTQDGMRLSVRQSEATGLVWELDPGQLPSPSPGDKFRIPQVKVSEDGYELTDQYADAIVHATEMLADDESTANIKTAIDVTHYQNGAKQFANPGTDTYRAWINGLIVRRHDQIPYKLRCVVAKAVGDANEGDVTFTAVSYVFPVGGSLNPAAKATVGPITVTLNTDPAVGVDLIFSGLIPLDAATPSQDVIASISITRSGGASDTYAGNCDLVVAYLETD